MDIVYKIPESVLVVIHTEAMDVLLIERTGDSGFWQSVTGSRETPDEPLRDTAIREIAEETGIHIGDGSGVSSVPQHALQDWNISNIYEIYPIWRHRYAPGITQNTEHVFGLLFPRAIPVALNPREHMHYLWLPYREAADKCFSPSNAEAILQLPNRHVNCGASRAGIY
jgi:dATP pyrophosphohydrolase